MQTANYENIIQNKVFDSVQNADIAHLKYIAYTGQFELVHSLIRNASDQFRSTIKDNEVFSQAICGSIKRINELKSVHNYELLKSEKQFLIELLVQFRSCCERTGIFPREYYESVIQSGEIFIQLNDLSKAYEILNDILHPGVNKFPNLRVDVISKLALILSRRGNIEKSGEFLKKMIYHPYFITDRNQIPEIFDSFSKTVLQQGDLKLYKSLLFTGLKYFYTNSHSRRRLFDQILKTYRNIFKLLTSNEVTKFNKATVFIHWCYYKIPDFRKIKLHFINRIFDKVLLASFYILNYLIRRNPITLVNNFQQNTLRLKNFDTNSEDIANKYTGTKKRILITRAMGGIGDLLMMTPGIHALKVKHPNKEINLAIPRRYFPIFENNPDVKLVNIEEDFFVHSTYNKWYNFTDCPAARVESRTAPKVKKNRIEIFAKELGVRGFRLLRMYKRPRIFLTDKEQGFANEFWTKRELLHKKVIGIQLHSDESYRDYPHMQSLVEKLSKSYTVLIFDANPINGFDFENVIKVHSLSLRKIFSLIQKCDAIVAPDSSFVHIAAAFNVPTVAVFGPIDGKIRTKDYPYCVYVDVSKELKCLPCWRNRNIPCQLTGLRNSICMESISVNKILSELKQIVN